MSSVSSADTNLEVYYTGELLHNAKGGIDTGSAYLSDAGLTIESGLDALFGGSGAKIFAYLLWNNGSTFSDRYVGDLQVVSNIDAARAVRVYELWYQQTVADNLSLRFGLYDLNSEFDVIESASLFLNSSHGVGAEFGQSGLNGPSIFPVTSLSVRLETSIGESGSLRYALLDGVPGDPDDPSDTTIDLGGGDGALQALEYSYGNVGGARFVLGGWLYSADFDRVGGGRDANGEPLRDDGNGGVYASVDAPIYSSPDSGLEINGFFRYGIANDTLNPLRSYLGAGTVLTGLITSRPDDQFGIAVASARVGDPYARQFATDGVDSRETSIELTYSTQVTDWLRLQPDLQYVISPGLNRDLDNALVLGLRFELSATREWNNR
ncbi:MAG: carbohydrate porin [Gammaproteobacteria bacterium]|nr:carbohydrate porin [Gammaproteobacteria bacterium]MDH3375129.1 carbohydrate porin [Gammaproteobacteria bacterium]MDH3553689.1 carbohydrate porin [Gammaproteobacteria bacterium]